VDHSSQSRLAVSNRYAPSCPCPGVESFGRWQLTVQDLNGTMQHGATVTPDSAPWRDVFALLDHVGADLPDSPPSTLDEADAIVAACWHSGSYARVLTVGEYFPAFRRDPSLSRITDDEMQRINLEFSSGVAAWLEDRLVRPQVTARRVRAAHMMLPMPWRADYADGLHRLIEKQAAEHAAKLEALVRDAQGIPELPVHDTYGLRDEANRIVVRAYRSGEIENLHAGAGSIATAIPGFVRFYAEDVRRVGQDASGEIAFHLGVRDRAERALLRILRVSTAAPLMSIGAGRWSLTEETSPVAYHGLPATPSLHARIQWLARRYPEAFGLITDFHESTEF
jgi:hypothetical protein